VQATASGLRWPAFALAGFGAAAFARFASNAEASSPSLSGEASEGWWAREDGKPQNSTQWINHDIIRISCGFQLSLNMLLLWGVAKIG
jgi:hypothetical protein